jgi:hypothetical protein
MLYAVLAYHVEADVMSWTAEQDATLMNNLLKAHERVKSKAGLGPTARLGETGRALTLRNGAVTDGPFAETKEALGGYYLIEAKDLDEAIKVAKQVPHPHGALEVRPVRVFD